MKPKFAFCGYPVNVPTQPQAWYPCGNIATPGCAYCYVHARVAWNLEDEPRPSRFDSRFVYGDSEQPPQSGYLSNPFSGQRITEAEIVDRAERRERRWRNVGEFCRYMGLAILVTLFFLLEPIHTWGHEHYVFFAGVALGSALEGMLWAVWRWRRGDRP